MTPQKALPTHTILDGKVHVFMRHGSPFWWVGFHFKGKYIRSSTKQKLLDGAKAVAQQWYFQKQTEIASGNISSPKHAFGKLADEALANYKKIFVDRGQRSQKTYDGIESIMKSRVKDYFSKMPVQQIDNTVWHKYKEDMITKYPTIKRGTLHQYKNAIRVVLNYAYKLGYLKQLPFSKMNTTRRRGSTVAHGSTLLSTANCTTAYWLMQGTLRLVTSVSSLMQWSSMTLCSSGPTRECVWVRCEIAKFQM